jgi:hypothetical protein
MSETHACESCSMPIETGRYCQYCTDSDGKLQPFEERFERMVAWQQRRTPDASRGDLERATLEFMSKMPAWKDNAELRARLAREN